MLVKKQKIVVILGPTCSGKTKLGIKLAKKFNGEIISADSRQIYKKMDIGTDKPKGQWVNVAGHGAYLVAGVGHYCVDIIDPGSEWSVADFKKKALEHIREISKRGKVPFLVGGTGLYIDAVVDNFELPKVDANKKLRQSLEEKDLSDLLNLLKQLDPRALKVIDQKNKRRVLRALEVVILTGISFAEQRKKNPPNFKPLIIGLRPAWPALKVRIVERIKQQVTAGLTEEVRGLLRQKYGKHLPAMSSIGYREITRYLNGEISKSVALAEMTKATIQYAKRQITWFKRDSRIKWFEGSENFEEVQKLVKKFLKK